MPLAEAVRFRVSDCEGAESVTLTVRAVAPPVMTVGLTADTVRLPTCALCLASNSVVLIEQVVVRAESRDAGEGPALAGVGEQRILPQCARAVDVQRAVQGGVPLEISVLPRPRFNPP